MPSRSRNSFNLWKTEYHIQPQGGAAEQQGTPEVLLLTAISTYRSLQSIHISKIVPKFRSLQDTAKQAKSYGSNSGNTVCRKGCCLYMRNSDVSKTIVKILGGFLKWEHTHNNKHTNPCDKMQIQRSQQFRISTGGTKVESQSHSEWVSR